MKKLALLSFLLLLVVSCSRHQRVSSRSAKSVAVSSLEQVKQDHSFIMSDHKKVRELFKWFDHQMDLKEDKVDKHEKMLSRYDRLKKKFYQANKSSTRLGIKEEMLTLRSQIERDHGVIMYDHNKFMEEIIDLVEYKRQLTGTMKVD